MPRSPRPIAIAGLAWLAIAGCRPEAPSPAAAVVAEPRAPVPDDRVGSLTAPERRGREIYLHGTAPGGPPIRALLGQSREPVDAALLACGNCHGQDGRGRPEGGVVPPDLTRQALSKPYGATDRFGRRRPAYTDATLRRAVTMGIDSSGRALDPSMPRYLVPPKELDDLIAYLAALGGDVDPGLSATAIRLGTLVPPEGRDPEGRRAVLSALGAFVDDANRRGGLFNRRLSLVVGDLDPTRDGAGEAVARFLEREPVFALLAADIRRVEEEVVRAVEARGVPLIGPLTPRPWAASPMPRTVFYLHSTLEDQARALATAMAQATAPEAAAIIHGDDPDSTRAGLAVTGAWNHVERIELPADGLGVDPDRLAARLAARRTGVLAYLGPPTLLRPLIVAANRARWRPTIGLLGALAGPDLFDLPPDFGGTIVLALPYLPDDMTPAGRAEYDRLRSAGGLPAHHQAAQMAALAAARVLVEGVRRCGRELSRARLVEELERFDEFPTGFSRPLTFGPSRRNGTSGAYLLTLDLAGKQLRPRGGWVDAGGPR